MNRISVRTNLDGVNIPYNLGEDMTFLPPIGSYIMLWCGYKKLHLEVVSIVYDDELWMVEIHVPKYINITLREWYRQESDIII
jgi:hypothetical protein